MRLWSFQDPIVAELAERGRRSHAGWRRVERFRHEPYKWLVTQMSERGLDTAGRPPWWAWHQYRGRAQRPDMRVYRPVGPGVLLTLDVPDEFVLLSCFDAWHSVLNGWYLSLNESEHEHMHREGREPTKREIESSWERIFDLDAGDPAWRGDPTGRTVQATLPYLHSDWIVKIERYKGYKDWL